MLRSVEDGRMRNFVRNVVTAMLAPGNCKGYKELQTVSLGRLIQYIDLSCHAFHTAGFRHNWLVLGFTILASEDCHPNPIPSCLRGARATR